MKKYSSSIVKKAIRFLSRFIALILDKANYDTLTLKRGRAMTRTTAVGRRSFIFIIIILIGWACGVP